MKTAPAISIELQSVELMIFVVYEASIVLVLFKLYVLLFQLSGSRIIPFIPLTCAFAYLIPLFVFLESKT